MSQSDDSKQSGPPSLFGSGDAGGQAADTRILASLEGRVTGHGPANKSRRAKGRGAAAGVALLLAAVGAGAIWLGAGHDDKPTVADRNAAAGAASGNMAAAADASAAAASIAAQAAGSESGPATVVDASPTQGNADDALDRLGRVSTEAMVVGAGTAAGAALLAREEAADGKATAGAGVNRNAPVVANTSNKKIRKQELNNTKITAANRVTTKQEKSGARAGASSQTKTPDSRVAANAGRKGAKPLAGNAGSDPDAELLAALLAPPVTEKNTGATRNRKTATTRRTQ